MHRSVPLSFGWGFLLVSAIARSSIASPPAVAFAATSPLASCTVHPDGQSEPFGQVFADSFGVARFYAPPTSWGSKLSLDCTGTTGTSAAYAVDLSKPDTYQLPALSQTSQPPKIRHALNGDITVYSTKQLIAMGYPPRPTDRASSSYKTWVKMVTQDVVAAPFEPITRLDRIAAPSTQYAWGGAMLEQQGTTYALATGTFVLPNITNDNNEAELALWTGVGGNGPDNPLIQAGMYYEAGYQGWVEYTVTHAGVYTGNLINLTTPTVPQVGDSIFVSSWATDITGEEIEVNGGPSGCTACAYGNFYIEDDGPSGGTPWYVMWSDSSQGHGTAMKDPLMTEPFVGDTAEFIFERLSETNANGTLAFYVPLADFGTGSMTNIAAQDSMGNDNHNFSTDTTVTWWIVDSAPLTLEEAETSGASTINYTFVRTQ